MDNNNIPAESGRYEWGDTVHHPSHYTKGGIECIAAIEASMTTEEYQGYLKGNVIKYLWRWRNKGGLEDLQKAKVYLDWLGESVFPMSLEFDCNKEGDI